MKTFDIVRAMKDADYRSTLSAAELAQVPQNAAGIVALSDSDLLAVSGGFYVRTSGESDTESGPCC